MLPSGLPLTGQIFWVTIAAAASFVRGGNRWRLRLKLTVLAGDATIARSTVDLAAGELRQIHPSRQRSFPIGPANH